MKRLPMFVLAGLAVAFSVPAHATSSPDSIVNGINSLARSNVIGGNGPVASPQVGTGGGPIGGICPGSPENSTVVLALLSGAGLLAGRSISRLRPARPQAL